VGRLSLDTYISSHPFSHFSVCSLAPISPHTHIDPQYALARTVERTPAHGRRTEHQQNPERFPCCPLIPEPSSLHGIQRRRPAGDGRPPSRPARPEIVKGDVNTTRRTARCIRPSVLAQITPPRSPLASAASRGDVRRRSLPTPARRRRRPETRRLCLAAATATIEHSSGLR
jgi:hypothetical protein